MQTGFNFFITTMPGSRPADYYLGCLDGSVFLDFADGKDDSISLIRISFDGYGCYDLKEQAVPISKDDSIAFRNTLQNGIQDQRLLETLVKKAILLNKATIRAEALNEYRLI